MVLIKAKGGKRIRQDRAQKPSSGTILDNLQWIASRAKRQESVDVVMVLGVDPRKSDQNVRGVAEMPAGLGKEITIAVFAQGEAAHEALKAGADYVGLDDLMQKFKSGEIEVDVCLSMHDVLPAIAKGGMGRVLRDKMPSKKSDTVVEAGVSLSEMISKLRAGKFAFRSLGSLIQGSIGRSGFKSEDLLANLVSVFNAVKAAKPAVVKEFGYIKKMFCSATMGASIKIDLSEMESCANVKK